MVAAGNVFMRHGDGELPLWPCIGTGSDDCVVELSFWVQLAGAAGLDAGLGGRAVAGTEDSSEVPCIGAGSPICV
jgi:hypothetical protein